MTNGNVPEGLGSSEGVEPASFTCSICMVESKSAVNHKAGMNIFQGLGSGFGQKKQNPGLCVSNEGRFLKVY